MKSTSELKSIPYTKAHGAQNDFLITWEAEAPQENLEQNAQRICDRNTGVGADGWILLSHPKSEDVGYQAALRLFNSDGSEAEISGNGTRCAAAFLILHGLAGEHVRLLTGAGLKHLRLLERHGLHFLFEMNMGKPVFRQDELCVRLPLASGAWEAALVQVGNPQCVLFVDQFPENWAQIGAEIERHPRFPNRTNVSFVKVLDRHLLEVRFYERGAGVTKSSGTGSTGAASAAILRGLAESPVEVRTPAGPLRLRWDGEEILLAGPAEIVARGEYYLP